MAENRARKHHQDRVAETLRLEIGRVRLRGEGTLADWPQLAACPFLPDRCS
jgi:hypothetical protein